MYLMRPDLYLQRRAHPPEHFAFPIKRYDVFYVTRDVFRKIHAGYAYAGNWTAKRNIARRYSILFLRQIAPTIPGSPTICRPGLDGIKMSRYARAAIFVLETAAAGGNEITHRERVRSIAGKNEFSPARISPSRSAINFQIQNPR